MSEQGTFTRDTLVILFEAFVTGIGVAIGYMAIQAVSKNFTLRFNKEVL